MTKTLTMLFFLSISVSAFAADSVDVPVQFVVPDRELTAAEKSFLATVPIEANGNLRLAVEQMLKAKVCHVTASGKYEGNSVHYWTLYQAWTGPHKIILTLPEPPPPAIPPPPPLPAPPTIINFTPRVEYPAPQVCPPPVVNNYMNLPTPERLAPQQPHAGAQIVHTRSAGADVMVGWGFGARLSRPPRLCKPPFPSPPIFDPPVRPAPAW